jgi:hypothetical protein
MLCYACLSSIDLNTLDQYLTMALKTSQITHGAPKMDIQISVEDVKQCRKCRPLIIKEK